MTASQLVAAVVAFTGTTIDDLVLLAVLFLARRVSGRPLGWVIIAGQFTGFAAILTVSVTAAAGLQVVPDRWIGLLGLVPIGFGIRGLWRLRGTDKPPRPPLASTLTGIATLTFANGADNITVFTPLFRSIPATGSALVTVLFLALLSTWCVIGAVLGSSRAAAATIGRIAHWPVPVVFIAVGVSIVIDSGTPVVVWHALRG